MRALLVCRMIAPVHRDRAHVNSKLKLLTEAGHFQVQISAHFGFARLQKMINHLGLALRFANPSSVCNLRHEHGQFEREASRRELWLS